VERIWKETFVGRFVVLHWYLPGMAEGTT